MSPECTVVIATYNNPEGAKDLVSDFYRLHDIDKFRLISIDQTRDGIKFDSDKPVHLHIKAYRNLGFAKAMNTGWKLSTTAFTLLANDDVRLLHPSWYESAKTHLTEDVLAVNPFPALRTWNAGGEPKWYWELEGNEEKFGWTKDKTIESYTEEDYKRLQSLLFGGDPPGTAMYFTLFKTEARDIVGLLDEGYVNNGEDYDWNRRCFLTCSICKRKKHEHGAGCQFSPYKILTCTHSLIHHHCGVTKQKAAANKELEGFDLVANAKNIFNKKWGTEEEPNPDIYGKTGTSEPNTPWCTEIDL